MDALVHALEAFISRTATPLARGLALEAARRIGPALPAVCRDGGNGPARDAMLLGANLAGLAFANSSCCAVHALALPLGGRFHIVHGVATGCLAAETTRHNLPAIREDVAVFAGALGWRPAEPDRFPDQSRRSPTPSAWPGRLRQLRCPDRPWRSSQGRPSPTGGSWTPIPAPLRNPRRWISIGEPSD